MLRLMILVVVLSLSASAAAAELENRLLECRTVEDLSSRLRCYDRLADRINLEKRPLAGAAVSEPQPSAPLMASEPIKQSVVREAKPAASAPEPSQSAPQTQPEEQPPTTLDAENLFGKSEREVQKAVAKELEVETVDEIRSRVVRAQQNLSKEYVVYLENGQVWKQKSNGGTWRIKKGETAIITTGTLGSFLMRSDARRKSVRAERLR